MARDIKIGVDWNGDGVAAIGYTSGDLLNDLPTWLPSHTDYTTIRKEVSAESVEIIPVITPFGKDAFRFHMNTTSPVTLRIFKSGASYDITTTNTRHYHVLFWYRLPAGAGGTSIVPAIYTNSDATFKVDGTAFDPTDTGWTRVDLSFQATASDNLTLRITKTGAGDLPFYVDITGLMVIEHTSAFDAPLGYNSGDSLDQYDNLSLDAFVTEWEGGFDPYTGTSGEKRATVELNNNHKRYSPDNTASPLYGYILPNRHFLIWWGANILYQGYLDTVTPTPFVAGDQTAVLEATNLVALLNKHKILLKAYVSKRADEIIADILSLYSQRLSDYSVDNGKLQTGLTTFLYYGDNSQQSDLTPQEPLTLWAILTEVTEAERGKVFIDKDGGVRFLNRHWSATATVSLTIDNTAQGIEYTPTAVSLINRIVVRAYPRVLGANPNAILWQLEKNLRVKAGRTRKVKAKYVDQATEQYCGGKDVITPTGSDFVTSGGSPSLSMVAGGEEAELTINNSAGTTDCIISTMNVRGTKIKALNPIETLVEDTDLIADYGLREIYFDLKALDNADDAENLANWELAIRSNLAGQVQSVTIVRESNGTANADQLSLDVGDIIRIIDDQLGIDANYVIAGYSHVVEAKGWEHQTTYFLERALSETFWVLGVSELGVNTRLGY